MSRLESIATMANFRQKCTSCESATSLNTNATQSCALLTLCLTLPCSPLSTIPFPVSSSCLCGSLICKSRFRTCLRTRSIHKAARIAIGSAMRWPYDVLWYSNTVDHITCLFRGISLEIHPEPAALLRNNNNEFSSCCQLSRMVHSVLWRRIG